MGGTVLARALRGGVALLAAIVALALPAGAAADGQTPPWVATWIASPQKPEQSGFDDVTLRLIVHTTIGGDAVRIRLSNEYGTAPLQIGAASVAIESTGAAVRPGTLVPLRFGGRTGVSIPAGGEVASDPVAEHLPADVNLAVSLYLPDQTGPPTEHADLGADHQTSYISGTGDHADDDSAADYPDTTTSWFFLDGVDVVAPGAGAVVAFGDSITDGTHSTDNSNHRYPNWLADRLAQAGGPYANLAVLNAGIGGNELLAVSACCGASPSGLSRFSSDVLDQPGVRDVIVLLGTNDILSADATPAALIAGLQQLIAAAHARGVRVFGATIPPSTRFSANPTLEQTREAVNQWILTSGAFDGVVNFAAAVADPSDPEQLNPVYNSGDNLHPDDTGYHAMADAVDLASLLPGPPPANVPWCLTAASLTPIKAGAPLDVTCHPEPPGYTYDDTAAALSYAGSWKHAGASAGYTAGDYDQTESSTTAAGSSVTVTFTGTGVEWVGPLDSNSGIADVSIDGGPATAVDTYSPWGKEPQQDVFTASGLRPGTHTLTITATGTKDASSSGVGIVVDAVDVTP